ncbi:MAG: glycosyltransferase [Nibricoccus sp.]
MSLSGDSQIKQSPARELSWAGRFYRRMLARHFRYFVPAEASVLEVGCGSGDLLAMLPNQDVTGVDVDANVLAAAQAKLPRGKFVLQAGEELRLERTFDVIIVSDVLNEAQDVQRILERLHAVAHPRTRLVLNYQNHLWRPLLDLATGLGLRTGPRAPHWLARTDVLNLALLSDWEVVNQHAAILCPLPLLGVDRLLNRWLAPLFWHLGLAMFLTARPRRRLEPRAATVSVIIPARNEQGNIAAAVERTPEMGAGTEIVFVEGGSSDDTWGEIQRVQQANPQRKIKILKQPGRGKGDAVRAGFAAASGEMLMILDADLTVPPEELPKFYEVLASNRAEFVNGSRLVYPMQKKAMPFLNMCVNKFFALAFSWLLGQSVKDTLCGTKVLWRESYDRIAAGRTYFGDFDPFGDFDLLFGASKLGLKIVDVPIRYKERTYGSTNIHRWRHGWLLLRMMFFAARRMKFIG